MVPGVWPSTWLSTWHVLILAPVYIDEKNWKMDKTQGISKEWDGVMGSTKGAHVQKHCVLKKDSKSIVCFVSKKWYSTKCSNKQKKSSGFDGRLGGSVGASSYKHIIHTWKGPQTLWFQKKMVQVLCWQELLQPAKNIWHTHIYIYRYVINIK